LFGAVLGLASFLPWYIAHAGGVPNPDNPIISHGFLLFRSMILSGNLLLILQELLNLPSKARYFL